MPAAINFNDSSLNESQIPSTEEQDGGIRIGDIYIPPPPLPCCSFDSKGPRLIISHIENLYFKSYAERQVLGPFHKNFTAIVGPNGSGKSNVIDAMLFVFGYRAQKIRTKKIGVLIHNSDAYPNVKSCTVKVHFQMIQDHGDSYEVLPDSGFCISRTAYKDNTSVYEIDGRRVPFKEVGKLLRSYGIDLDHNRFLILQGEIEMIAMMKPKGTEHETGMLEYIEDIIGCNRFIEPLEKMNLKIDELVELRNDKLNRLKIIEEEKKEVETARNEALEYLKYENKITLRENSILQIDLHEAQFQLQNVVKVRDEAKKELNVMEKKHEELKHERSLRETVYAEVCAQFDKCAAKAEEYGEKYNALEREDATCRDNIANAREKLRELVSVIQQEDGKAKQLAKQAAVHEGEALELEKKKEMAEKKKENEEMRLNQVMASMKEEISSLQEEKQKQETCLIGLKKAVSEMKAEVDIVQNELDIYISNETNERSKLQELEKERAEVISTIKANRDLCSTAETKIPEFEKKLKDNKDLEIRLTGQLEKLSAEVRTKRLKVEEARSAMSATKSQNAIVQCLMEQKRCGNIPGIFGRLGDLGAIDEKYDIAISTACGSLDNIVTDTINTAQKCVEYLKRHNKGYVTFIALDKMERWIPYTTQKFCAPEDAKRLYDLVRVQDKRVLPAFYFALRDTLVTNDLEQATRIGLHGQRRYRCVTLKGEIIELSGTMSGGGNRPMKGRMGKSVANTDISAEKLDEMMRDLNESIKSGNTMKQEIDNIQQCIATSEKQLVSMQQILKKNTFEYESLNENLKGLTKQIQLQKSKVAAAAPDSNKVKELNSKLEEKKKHFEKADKAASAVEGKVKSLHEEMQQITKERLGALQKNVNKLAKEIDTIQGNLTKCKVAVKNALRNKKKLEDKIKGFNEEVDQTKQAREDLTNEYTGLEARANAVLEKREEAKKEMQEWSAKKKEINQFFNEAKEEEMKLKSQLIELKNSLKTKESVVKEKTHAVRDLEHRLGKLKLHEIDGEGVPEMPQHTVDEVEQLCRNLLMYEIGTIQADMAKMNPNMAAITEFRKKEELYQKKLAEVNEVTAQRDEMKKCYDDLGKQRHDEFVEGFKLITTKLKEVYQMITLGGDAELELVDSHDPFSEGVVFSVRPPKKSWKNITNLSGGEKTLSSLALVFALHYYKPTPFYVMDEIDAALDFKNVSIVGNYIKERTKNAQFIIISLRNNMFELSDRLVGIYKTYNSTKCVTISPRDITNCLNGTCEMEELAAICNSMEVDDNDMCEKEEPAAEFPSM